MNKQVKLGALFSYILIFLNATYGLFLTPFLLGQIGDVSYGIYKTISALTASLMVLDSGIGASIMRYVAKYRADKEEKKIPNFLFMGLCQTGIICAIIVLITAVLFFFIDGIYANLTPPQLSEAKMLYVFLAIGMVAHIIENYINGIISGYNRFFFSNGCRVVRLLIRIAAIVLFVSIFKSTLALVLVDLLCTILFSIIEILYLKLNIKISIHYSQWDNALFKESFVYVFLMFLGTLVDQVNGNISNIIVGSSIGPSAVTVYSMAVLIFGMYMNVSCAISNVLLPTVTMTLKNDDETYSNTQKLIVRVGRIQFLFLGAVAFGFLCVGKPFLKVWLGEGFDDVYILTNILLFPALFELCINVCLSILRAKNLLGFRTLVVSGSAIFNLIFILVAIPHIGYFAASLGTACSYFFGSVVIMGIYYYKKLKINILKLYVKVFKGIGLCVVISAIGCFLSTLLFSKDWVKLIVGFLTFCIIYATTLLLFGLNKDEKNIILKKFRRKKA